MEMMKRRELTTEERADATRLAAAWEAYKIRHKGVTQTWLGAEAGLGTQGAVGQYLRGVIPLNLGALMAFARVLELDPREISPRLTSIVEPMTTHGGGLAQSMKVSVETAEELRLLTGYRLADQAGRAYLDEAVTAVLQRADLVRKHKL